MSNCSNATGVPWDFTLKSDNSNTTLKFSVNITDSGTGNGLNLTIVAVEPGSGENGDYTFSNGLCQTDPHRGKPVLSFLLNLKTVVGGMPVTKILGVVGNVEVISAASKVFSGGYFAIATVIGLVAALAPDPGDTGTAGGSTGA